MSKLSGDHRAIKIEILTAWLTSSRPAAGRGLSKGADNAREIRRHLFTLDSPAPPLHSLRRAPFSPPGTLGTRPWSSSL